MKKTLTRTLSGAVYVAIVVSAIYAGRWLGRPAVGFAIFSTVFLAMAVIGLYEFYHNLDIKGVAVNKGLGYIVGIATYIALTCFAYHHLIIYAVAILPCLWSLVALAQLWRKDERPFATIGYTLTPTIWIVIPLFLMQSIGNYAAGMLMMMFICTWVNDTGAYLVGKTMGRHHMWEYHSPNKTWEGTLGGALFCILCAIFVGPLLQDGLTWWYWAIIGIICSGIGTLGDLVESMFKRSCGVKDSGKIMPGHGGILDRIDSILMIIPFIWALVAMGQLI